MLLLLLTSGVRQGLSGFSKGKELWGEGAERRHPRCKALSPTSFHSAMVQNCKVGNLDFSFLFISRAKHSKTFVLDWGS